MRKKERSTISYLSKNKEEIKELKVILLGDTGVGKTNIINRFLFGTFDENLKPTLASSSLEKNIKRDDGEYILKVWDTTGQERYNSITKLFIKGSQIVILVYAIDNLKSFENINFWRNLIKDELDRDEYILAIVGNKKDLFEHEAVDEEKGKKLADDLDADFSLISAKYDTQSINDLFNLLLDRYISKMGEDRQHRDSIKIHERTYKKKACC